MADIGKDAEKQAAGSLGSEILQIFQEKNCLFQHLKMLFCDKKSPIIYPREVETYTRII